MFDILSAANALNQINISKPSIIIKKEVTKRELPETKKLVKTIPVYKSTVIRAHLVDEKSALFYNKYYNKNTIDPFYKLLKSKNQIHKEFVGAEDIIYRTCFNERNFNFKLSKTAMFYDANENCCLIDDCFGKDVSIEIRIVPYKYDHLAGISLKVSKIKICSVQGI